MPCLGVEIKQVGIDFEVFFMDIQCCETEGLGLTEDDLARPVCRCIHRQQKGSLRSHASFFFFMENCRGFHFGTPGDDFSK